MRTIYMLCANWRKLGTQVNKIIVKSVNKQKPELTINFNIPLIDDSLIYKNPLRKSEGYQIKDGIKDLIVEINNSKNNFTKINIRQAS